jgi:hypothetical protein
MEEVLDVYERDYDPQRPVICFDERPAQLIGDVVMPIAMKPGKVQRQDHHYKRNGTCCVMMAIEPLAGNFLKTVEFEHPAWIPAIIALMPATWKRYGQDLEKIVLGHPGIFPDYQKGINDFGQVSTDWPTYRKGRFTDSFGCVWENAAGGLAGLVMEYPLEDWRV